MYSWSSPPMWSFGESIRGEELKAFTNYHTPGPGTHDEVPQDLTKTAYPSWKVGTSERPPLYGSSNPDVGPGSYEASKAQGKKNPKKTFGKSKRGHSEFKGISTVGPDAYNPKKFGKVPPSFSFGYKTDGFGSNWKSDVPGPGAYEIKDGFGPDQEEGDEAFRHTRSAFTRTAPQARTMSREPGLGTSGLPGPGSHFHQQTDKENYDFRYFHPTWSFGKASRDDLYNNEAKNVPGPGRYPSAGTINTKIGFTILGKNESKGKGNTSYTPGPNVYNQNIQPLKKSAPSFRIGKAERKDMSTGTPEFPGPGAYADPLPGKPIYIKGTFGFSGRPGLYAKEKNPGPGEYEVRGNITKGTKKYSMGVKTVRKTNEVYPGPGEYEPFGSLYLDKNIGAIIGTSERPPLYKKGMAPGPGQYDITGEITDDGTKSKIGYGKRPPMTKASDEPGPGYYNIPSAIANVQKYLMPYFADEKRRTAAAQEPSFRGIFGSEQEECGFI